MRSIPRLWPHAFAGLLLITGAALWRNTPQLSPGAFNWAEPGNVAAALVEGRGFSDPFGGGTGATAWVPPLPVLIDALAFTAGGVKTAAAAKILLSFAVVGLAATHALLFAALAPGGVWLRSVGCGIFLAEVILLPGGPLVVRSEAWLNMLLSAALLYAALQHRRQPGPHATNALIAVALLGPLAHAGLALATIIVLLALAWRDWRGKRWHAAPYVAAGAAVLAVGGWSVRNYAVFGHIVPLKSNLWFELHLANVAAPDGIARGEVVLREMPFFNVAAFERYARLGEIAYVDTFRAPTLAAIKAEPAHFVGNIARRAQRALVFCFTDEGNGPAHVTFPPGDALKLAQAGELLLLGDGRHWAWMRLDAPPADAHLRFAALGLADFPRAWQDWAEARLAYDERRLSAASLAAGFLTAGAPVLALLLAAAAGRGKLGSEAAWAALISGAVLAPFIAINHNPRQQAAVLAMQAVFFGACTQAWVNRRREGTRRS